MDSSGQNIYNSNSGFVGIGCNSTSTVAKLDVCGSSSGANYLIRIDDTSSSPGINFYGNSIKLGSIAGDTSAAFRVRAGNDASQVAFTQGITTFEDQTLTTGATTVNIQAGAGQSTTNLFQINNNSGTTLAFIDSTGEFAAPVFNGTGNSANFTFQNFNSTFLVDTTGDVTLSGQLAIASISGSTQCLQVNSSGIVSGTGAACGSGGGGSSPPFPDNTALVESNADHTKLFLVDASTNIPNSTTVTMHVPAVSFTPVSEENTETISGAKTFTSTNVTANLFNAVNTTTNLVFNSAGFEVDGNGIVNETAAGGAILAAGYVASGQWYGFAPQAITGSLPAVGYGYSAIAYCPATTLGCSDGLTYWFWVPSPTSAWSKVDLGGAGGSGITSLNSQTGPAITIAGTANQVAVANATNTITLSVPASFATTTITSTQTSATGNAFVISNSIGSGNPLIISGQGDTNIYGAFTAAGNSSSTGPATFRICLAGNCSNAKTIIDYNGNITVPTGGSGVLTLAGISGSTQCLQVNSSGVVSGTGSACGSGGGGGVSSLNSLMGALSITNGSTSNEITVTPSGSTIALTLPQGIGTGSTPTFGSVTAQTFTATASGSTSGFVIGSNFSVSGTGALSTNSTITAGSTISTSGGVTASQTIQSTISGGGIAFQAGGGTFDIYGNGNVGAQTISAGSYCIGASCASTVINGSSQFVGSGGISTSGNIITTGSAAIESGGNIQAGGVFAVAGGFFGSSTSVVIGGCTIFFQGGIYYAKSGSC